MNTAANTTLDTLALAVKTAFLANGLTLATAESCTGGRVASLIVGVPGASAYFKGGVVAYSNDVKTAVLGVDAAALAMHGAVSREVVEQMARGACRAMRADCAVATSGVAGPEGGTPDKPVGTICIAAATPAGVRSAQLALPFDRAGNIEATIARVLEMLLSYK
jgi:competence/damage-inducible protein CinA C-terminal domain